MKIFFIVLILTISSSLSVTYIIAQKLTGRQTFRVDEHVYVDICKHENGYETILEFKVKYVGYSFGNKCPPYTFRIGQSSQKEPDLIDDWKKLSNVQTENCINVKNSQEATYRWSEIKKGDSKYIFIMPNEPKAGYSGEIEIYLYSSPGDIAIFIIISIIILGLIAVGIYFLNKCIKKNESSSDSIDTKLIEPPKQETTIPVKQINKPIVEVNLKVNYSNPPYNPPQGPPHYLLPPHPAPIYNPLPPPHIYPIPPHGAPHYI